MKEIGIQRKMLHYSSQSIFTVLVGFTLFVGWRLRDYRLITAEEGLGYALGITGASLMLVLLVYPLRKRVRALQKIGSVKAWFRTHMILGVLGPVCILFHANFHLGSLNGNVALFSMLIVSVSGVAGRYFYSKIHHGLYGKRADLMKLRDDVLAEEKKLGKLSTLIPAVQETLLDVSQHVLETSPSVLHSIKQLIAVRVFSARILRQLLDHTEDYLSLHAKSQSWSVQRKEQMLLQVRRKVRTLLRKSIRVAEYSCYDRLFALWHVLHIPLFFMMVGTIVVHIVAVHSY